MLRTSAGRGDSYSQGGSEIELSQAAAMEGDAAFCRRFGIILAAGFVRWSSQSGRSNGLQNLSSLPHYQNRNEGRGLRYPKGDGAQRTASQRSVNLPMDRNVPPVSMVRRPSPYADIPSLYDMYVQASGRESTQERFGLKIFRNNSLEPDAIPMDLPVGPEYVVGPGDGLAINALGGVRSACFELWIAKGRSRARKRALAGERRSLGDVQRPVSNLMRTQYR